MRRLTTAESVKHRGDYGVDGSFHRVPLGAQLAVLAVSCTALAVYAGIALARGQHVAGAVAAVIDAFILAQVALYWHNTRSGKFRAWERILDDLALRGDETLLDMGCGRGAVLCAAAKRLPHGRAIGVDLWQADQTGNSADATWANAALEGVSDRIEVHTGDMTALPLADASVDVVVSSLAIHNIGSGDGRRRALAEAARVVRPGGRLAIADLWDIRHHAAQLREIGWRDVKWRNLGWRMWYGGPWTSTRLVTATKPG
ncbi:class I SAM-dependent methyltransferase [[Mycobacterium] nativiensis]|uniref:Class I SAM-dependent methyltransferase n=1 Tax=[Mycobacterium] nativiensis TaxID=2855503 RepID=A0ABU5XVN1_9MYCO|nr:class I SAM-dependent methyltransferase [Mycolicibacter sp. MYC340]MEB3032039.1 class I SAM-dependent methyltransferase [Mycolicibacter sp. MYC340]